MSVSNQELRRGGREERRGESGKGQNTKDLCSRPNNQAGSEILHIVGGEREWGRGEGEVHRVR